jgi:hypothetical protein
MKAYKENMSKNRVEYKVAVDKVVAQAKLDEAEIRKIIEEEKAALCVDAATGRHSVPPARAPGYIRN